MSGWQRIGVVISVLWLVGFPIYLMVSTNQNASVFYSLCRKIKYDTASSYRAAGQSDLADATDKGAHEECWKPAGFTSASKMASDLVAGDAQAAILWAFILVPVVLFWLVGGAVFGIVRWIRRGFASSGKA
jgi:hypothetical protein